MKKTAFKEGKAKHFKKFHLMDQKQLQEAMLRQNLVRGALGATKEKDLRKTIKGVKAKIQQMGPLGTI